MNFCRNFIFISFVLSTLGALLNLCLIKPVWVDECYTFYGSNHDSIYFFWDSMISGINFSPPLYFLINWFLDICFSISIEVLRLESILWTVVGLFLFYQASKKTFGIAPSAISIMLVVSQSNLLLNNSTDARHYTMLFACSSWVFFTLTNLKYESKQVSRKEHFLLFISHFCLCLTHYLGIVFSLLVGVGLIFCEKKTQHSKRVPWSILLCWTLAISTYLFLLQNQSSHLNTWPKASNLTALLENYDYAALGISVIIAVLSCLVFSGQNPFNFMHERKDVRLVITISIMWFLTPVLFWLLANISPLNLLKDRYFIPKEIGLLTILAFVLNRIGSLLHGEHKEQRTNWSVALLVVALYSTFTIFTYHKRSSFGYSENRNYYNWLHIDDSVKKLDLPIVLSGDPLFFPNTYRNEKQHFFLIDDKNSREIYSKFSSKLNIVSSSELLNWDSFILVGKADSLENFDLSLFSHSLLGKVHEQLPILIKKFERI